MSKSPKAIIYNFSANLILIPFDILKHFDNFHLQIISRIYLSCKLLNRLLIDLKNLLRKQNFYIHKDYPEIGYHSLSIQVEFHLVWFLLTFEQKRHYHHVLLLIIYHLVKYSN